MKVGKIFIAVLFSSMTTSMYCQNTSQVHIINGMDSVALLSCKIGLNFPFRFYKQRENYEEGVFYTYFSRDGAYITVFQGALMSFPEDTYIYTKKKRYNNRITYSGCNNGYYWRKDSVYKNVRIYYNNVNRKKKRVFDKILDKISIIVL